MELMSSDTRISDPLGYYSFHIFCRNIAERSGNINFLSKMTIQKKRNLMILSAPAEKRRDFLERNPHLRAKLRKRKRKKKTKTTTIATIENNNPEQTTPSLVQSAPATNTASSAPDKKTNSKTKSNLENLVLQRKDPSKKGKLKISGKLSFT